MTAVVSLHQVDLARRFADRVVGISAGAVAFDGTPDQLTNSVLRRIYGGVPEAAALMAQRPPVLETQMP